MNKNILFQAFVIIGILIMVYSAFVFSYILYFVGVVVSIGSALLIKDEEKNDIRSERLDDS